MRLPLIAVALLTLAACAPTAPPPGPSAQAGDSVEACTARGGQIETVGRRGLPTCVVPFADAGKACTDGSQCQGGCVLEGNLEPSDAPVTGQCKRSNVQFGCYAKVVGGKATSAICVD
ncbi:hypothetical protein [Caulobacter hibisci]|uniref:Secreted protein n=1 Tax=Caulobacter hibisci TaxID=2035993 RepID=A0ABS0T2P3_9CAUL|nr:hypothetical protein [Caulobacter hibisci]MBI1685756.1 hypothetical protein [Caulobacter hibisci]